MVFVNGAPNFSGKAVWCSGSAHEVLTLRTQVRLLVRPSGCIFFFAASFDLVSRPLVVVGDHWKIC